MGPGPPGKDRPRANTWPGPGHLGPSLNLGPTLKAGEKGPRPKPHKNYAGPWAWFGQGQGPWAQLAIEYHRRLGLLRYIGAVAFSLWELCVLFHSLGPFLYKL